MRLGTVLRSAQKTQLVLFTSGPACSLCEIAKQSLERLDKQLPDAFAWREYDIRKRAAETDEEALERTRWAKKYIYDVPVLHRVWKGADGKQEGEQIMKHRIDEEKLAKLIKEWQSP